MEAGTDEACAGWMKAIEQEYGKIPLIFQRMAERPEVLVSHLLYKDAVTKTSALDPKQIELTCLAVGAALKCVHCTGYHMQAALKMGAIARGDPRDRADRGPDLELLGPRERLPRDRRQARKVRLLRDPGDSPGSR